MGIYNQVLTACASSFCSLIMGLLNVWPSYTVNLYTAENTTLLWRPMTEFESSMIGSIPSLGAMLGTAYAGITIDTLGRKTGGILLMLPYIISWAIVELTKSSLWIIVARFLGGTSGGAALMLGPIFISETADDSIRGLLASGPVTFYSLGVLLSYLMGWFCSYHAIIQINLVSSIFGVILLSLVIESPLYLMRKGREDEAEAAVAGYLGCSLKSKEVMDGMSKLKRLVLPPVEMITVTEPEIADNIEKCEKNEMTTYAIANNEQKTIPSWKLLYSSPSSRRALMVVGTILTLQVFMGMVPVQIYAKELFAKAAPTLSPHLCSVMFAITLLTGCVITASITDKAGRRILIITSAILVGLCNVSLGFLLQTEMLPAWVTALLILFFCFFFYIGSGNIPYVLLSESFKPEVQSIASMILVEWVWFINFVMAGVFPYMVKLMGLHGVFYLFAVFSALNVIAGFTIVPETKGLSNAEIQEVYLRRK